MRYLIAFFVFFLFLATEKEPLSAQQSDHSVLEGRIIDRETGEPLMGAHVFLSGTTIGTVTNAAGRYRLSSIPPGAYSLTVSIIGFRRASIDTLVRMNESKTVNVALDSVVYELDEMIVHDEDWEKDLERFTRLFIGESERADSVIIVNPEVLSFSSRWWGRFSATAVRPLIIENNALGYRITYFLDEFRHSGRTTRWDGDPLFEKMTPADSLQEATWEENRKTAFYGSLRHFLLALIRGLESEEGFILFQQQQSLHTSSMHNRRSISSNRLITPDKDEQGLYKMNFSGRLEVIYTEASEDDRFIRWDRNRNRRPSDRQTSHLELNMRPITIDRDGEIVETYGATRYGYLSYRRVAEQTPRDYRPRD